MPIVPDLARLTLQTSKGTDVRNRRRIGLDPAIVRARMREHGRAYPAIRPRSIRNTHNCFGLVFANRRTCIEEDSEIRKILHDDEYQRIPRSELQPGDVVLYAVDAGRIDHAAIVLQPEVRSPSEIFVLSAWGQDGEYIHPIDQLPEILGRATEFWTDRRM
jgi:hypothetical protein